MMILRPLFAEGRYVSMLKSPNDQPGGDIHVTVTSVLIIEIDSVSSVVVLQYISRQANC